MKTYKPLPVLPEFTDERLGGPDTLYERDLAELLLTIPAEYRQAAMAESAARTMVFSSVLTDSGMWLSVGEPNGVNVKQARADIIAEIRTQLSRSEV